MRNTTSSHRRADSASRKSSSKRSSAAKGMAALSARPSGEPGARVASVRTWSIASRWMRCAVASSRMEKPGATPASSGKRCNSRSQKEWIVCTLSPPGVSIAMVKSVRARAISSLVGACALSSVSFSARSSGAMVTHCASVS